jgi:hypothetical protein
MVDIARYKYFLRQLMCFKHDVNYPRDKEFTPEELQAVTPLDIYHYFKFRAYGDADLILDNEEELAALGVSPGDLDTHSARKGGRVSEPYLLPL